MRAAKFRKGTPTHAAELIRAFLHRGQTAKAPSQTARAFAAYQALGEPFRSRSEPVFFRNHVLTVRVEGSAWLTEFSMLRDEILRRLAVDEAEPLIREVRFQAGTVPPPAVCPLPAALPVLPPEDGRVLDGIVADVSDPDLRAALRRILAYAWGRRDTRG